ncbi:unnamed protein product [Caretta caretta]
MSRLMSVCFESIFPEEVRGTSVTFEWILESLMISHTSGKVLDLGCFYGQMLSLDNVTRFSLPVQHLSSGRAPSPAKRTPPTLNNEESISKIKVMTDAWDLNPLANGKPLERSSKESLDVPSGPRDTADDASRRTVADDDKGLGKAQGFDFIPFGKSQHGDFSELKWNNATSLSISVQPRASDFGLETIQAPLPRAPVEEGDTRINL